MAYQTTGIYHHTNYLFLNFPLIDLLQTFEYLKQLPKLEVLDVGNNKIKDLPSNIGNLSTLRKLFLWNNQMINLPPTIGDLVTLEELDLSNKIV